MSSPSSLLPLPPPPPPPTGTPSGPPPPPPTGAISGLPPPPPPPSSSPPPPSPTNTSTANYFFGFIITFIVLLLLFIGCSVGSWRRFRLIGTALDEQLQDMEGTSFTRRKRGRRRLIRPVFWETWTYSKGSTLFTPAYEKAKWMDVQPVSAAFIWSRTALKSSMRIHKSNALTQTPGERQGEGSGGGMSARLRSYFFSERPHYDHSPRPPPVERPPPEAIQVAVMIAMPFPPSLASDPVTDRPNYVGQSRVGEYQIGVVRIPWL